MDCSLPGFAVRHQLPELIQTHVHRVSDAIQPSQPVIPFSSCLQSFPASGSFPVSLFFTSGGQTIGASASVLPMNTQDWFPLGWTGWISLQSKGLSRVFSNSAVQKNQFFGSQPSLWSTSHIIHDYWKKHSFETFVVFFNGGGKYMTKSNWVIFFKTPGQYSSKVSRS